MRLFRRFLLPGRGPLPKLQQTLLPSLRFQDLAVDDDARLLTMLNEPFPDPRQTQGSRRLRLFAGPRALRFEAARALRSTLTSATGRQAPAPGPLGSGH